MQEFTEVFKKTKEKHFPEKFLTWGSMTAIEAFDSIEEVKYGDY
jgi:hypothetical protein